MNQHTAAYLVEAVNRATTTTEAEARQARDLRKFFGGDGYINKWVDNDGHASFEFHRDKEDAANDASLECPRDHKGYSVQYERTLACVGGVVGFVDLGVDRRAEDF